MKSITSRLGWFAFTAVACVTFALVGPYPSTAQLRPAIVRDVDNGDRQEIYRLQNGRNWGWGETAVEVCATAVPAGKRLILEHASITITLPPGQGMSARIFVDRGLDDDTFDDTVVAYVPLFPQGDAVGQDRFSGSMPLRARVAAGERPCIQISRSPHDGAGVANWSFTGYMVDAP